MNNIIRTLILLVLCGVPSRAVEFKLLDKLSGQGGIEISTSATAAPIIFASSTTGAGYVGIGTSSPGARLEVAGGSVTVRGLDTQSNTFAVGSQTGAFKVVVSTGGNVGISTTSPVAALDAGARTDGMIIPTGLTSARPNTPVRGTIRYNTDLNRPEYYTGTKWRAFNTSIATGGHVVDFGGYRIHTFTTSGEFTVTENMTVDILVVAGGGSGGNYSTTNANGGGGGGGVLYSVGYALTPGVYPVTVGAGGSSVYGNGQGNGWGVDGGKSVFGTLVAIGGGGGGATGYGGGRPGGSGGGASSSGGAGASTQGGGGGGTTAYGNAGGSTTQSWTGAGGGGAGSAGISGNVCSNCAPSGNGGAGIANSISGITRYYAGGGGGGGNSSERAGDGYDGGGRGFGSTTYYGYTTYTGEINPTTRGSGNLNAIQNTGGGGGGGSYWSASGYWSAGSGAGGSGIVIIRYPIP